VLRARWGNIPSVDEMTPPSSRHPGLDPGSNVPLAQEQKRKVQHPPTVGPRIKSGVTISKGFPQSNRRSNKPQC
jgi:hypothetical protein